MHLRMHLDGEHPFPGFDAVATVGGERVHQPSS